MDEQSRQFLLEKLDASEAEMMAGLEGMSAEEAAFRPANGAWTIAECLEHLVTTETLSLRGMMKRAAVLDEPLVRREHSAALFRNFSVRSGKIEAPERVRPSGRYSTLAESIAAFREIRARIREYVADGSTPDLDSLVLPHPVFGELTNYEWVLVMAAHVRRHLEQIREIRRQFQQSRTASAMAD